MNIAVAIDGSENANRAAKHALMLVKHLPNARLDIIFVIDYDKAKSDYLLAQSSESLALQREQKVLPVLELAQSAGVDAKVQLLKGKPSVEIIKYVNEQQVDLLVVGSRGLNTFQEMVLGSVSHKVMKHANCPVTVVK